MNGQESQLEGQFIQKQRPRTAYYKQTQFKDRRLITLLNCKMIFQIIWEGIIKEKHDSSSLLEDEKKSINREKVIYYSDLEDVVNYTAELLNK